MDPLSVATQGSPGQAVVIKYNGPYHPPVQKESQEELRAQKANEASKKKILDSNGKVIDLASKADMYDNDKTEVAQDLKDFIDQQAEYLWNKTDVNIDPEAYTKSKKMQQDILDKISKKQQQKKAGDIAERHVRLHPDLYPDGTLDEIEAWKQKSSDERGVMPPVKALGETDILSKLDVYNPGPTAFKRENPLPDGTIEVLSGVNYDPTKGAQEAEKVLMMQEDRRVKRLKEYALENVVAKAYPNWKQMPPDQVGQLVNDAASKMLQEHWKAQTRTSSSRTTKKATQSVYGSGLQIGLGEAIKSGIVKKDVPVNIAYEAGKDSKTGADNAVVKSHIIPYIAAIPQTVKTKAVVPGSINMTDIKTGKPIKDPAAYMFIPGENAVYIKDGKVKNVVMGYIIDKANFAGTVDPTIMAQKTVTSDVEVPLEFIESNLKSAGVQTQWTYEAEKDLEGRLKKYKSTNPTPAKTVQNKKSKWESAKRKTSK